MPTIGVAVAIPEPWATELQDYRTSVGDAMAATIPTHVTLVPPTEVADDELEKIEAHLAAAAADVPALRRCTCAAPARSGRSRRWSS